MERIFVYGSLRVGMYNYDTYLKGRVSSITKAYIKGALYTIKGVAYPALINGNDFITGEIMELADKNIWEALDKLEGYYGIDNSENEYDKVIVDIYDINHTLLDKLPVYFYNMNKDKHKNALGEQILTGDYVKYMQGI